MSKYLDLVKRIGRYIFKGIPTQNITANVYQLSSEERLKGRNIIITGGSKGIGFYIAKKCVEEGARVLITGRNELDLINAKNKLGERCLTMVHDISCDFSYDTFFLEAKKLFGNKKIDSLVNNAGISIHGIDYSTCSIEDWDKQFNINLKGLYFFTQAFVKQCISFDNTKGNIVNISSERGLYCDDVPYGLIKNALNAYTRGLSRRLLKYGVRVNAIAPGVTVSQMTGYTDESNLYRESTCGKRVLIPEEIAEVAIFLLSDNSNCISGEVIACNMGNHLRCDW